MSSPTIFNQEKKDEQIEIINYCKKFRLDHVHNETEIPKGRLSRILNGSTLFPSWIDIEILRKFMLNN